MAEFINLYFMNNYNYSLLSASGKDVFISHNVEIKRPHLVKIGNHVAIDSGFYCTTKLEIGDYIHIAPYVTVIGGGKGLLKMGHFTGIAAGCRIICGSDGHLGDGLIGPVVPEKYKDKLIIVPVVFQPFSSIATNVVIIPGVTLAEGSVIGACSLVTKSTEPWTIYYGIPAKPIKMRRKDIMIKYAKELGYNFP